MPERIVCLPLYDVYDVCLARIRFGYFTKRFPFDLE